MIALRLVRLIEVHSDNLAKNIVEKIRKSRRTSDLQRVGEAELVTQAHEFLQSLGDWLLTKTEDDIEIRCREAAFRRAEQGIDLADVCWAMILTKEQFWEFVQKEGLLLSPIELHAELELLWLLDTFFDHALCCVVEGYQCAPARREEKSDERQNRAVNPAAWVP